MSTLLHINLVSSVLYVGLQHITNMELQDEEKRNKGECHSLRKDFSIGINETGLTVERDKEGVETSRFYFHSYKIIKTYGLINNNW